MSNINSIKTRILNKISTWAEWKAVEETFKPLRGEVCIVEIPTDTTGTGLTPPATGIKIGNGQNYFKDLPWVQAVAGDVPSYVKGIVDQAAFNSLIDNYTISDGTTIKAAITALQSRVRNLEDAVGSSDSGLIKDVNTLKTTVSNHTTSIDDLTNNKVNTNVAEIATESDKLVKESTVNNKISTVKTALLGTDGIENTHTIKGAYDSAKAAQNTADSAYSLAVTANNTANTNQTTIEEIQEDIREINDLVGGTGDTSVSNRLDVLEDLTEEHTTNINANTQNILSNSDAINAQKGRIDTLIGNVTNDNTKSVRTIAAEETAKIVAGADENYDTLKEIADWIKSDTTGAAEMANDISEMQNLLGVTEGETLPKTVNERISDAITNANLDQYATDADLISVTDRISTIETTYATKVYADQSETDAINTAIGASNDLSSVNTIYGAKKYAEEQANAALSSSKTYTDQIKNESISASNSFTDTEISKVNNTITGLTNRFNTLTSSSTTESNGVIETISFSEDKVIATHKLINMNDIDGNAVFIFNCGDAFSDTSSDE